MGRRQVVEAPLLAKPASGVQKLNVLVRYQRRSGGSRIDAGDPFDCVVIGINCSFPITLRPFN